MIKEIEKLLINLINKNFNLKLETIKIWVSPKNMFWDYSFNWWILARDLKKNPVLIVEELKKIIDSDNNLLIEETELTWAYLNIKVNNNIYTDLFNKFYNDKESLLWNCESNNKSIVIDYIWANVWKPLHIGHMCTPNQWQVLVNLYKKIWYKVVADSHIGDWWIIFWKLILAYKFWWDEGKLEKEAINYLLELYVKITEETEKDETFEQKTRDEFKLLSEGNIESVKLWKKFTSFSISAMQIQLDRLNIKPDYNIWESFYEGLWLPKMENFPDLKDDMHSIVTELIEKWIAIKNEDNSVGVLFDEDLKIPSCILQKRDWTHGYLASDLAAIKYRMQNWNPEKIVYFVDSRQQLHLRQAFLISKLAWWIDDTELFHAANGFISLKDWAMSTRKWRIIKLDKLLDEAENRAKKIILEKRDDINWDELDKLSKMIWIWAIKYWYLKKNRETDVIFDWDEFMSFEWNSGPYIQYAYVRTRWILENYGEVIDKNVIWNFEYSEEIELIKKLSDYKLILNNTAKSNSPHILCKYSYELTKTFNTFYNSINILKEEDENKKINRLKLVELFWDILKDSFNILWIEMPDKM